MPSFNPQYLEVKEQGRVELAKSAGLRLKDAAPYFTVATHRNFQSQFNKFVTVFPEPAKLISDNRPDGVGPGEMIAWFLFDNLHLGGKNGGIDLWLNGKEFAEMKGGIHNVSEDSIDYFKITKDNDPCVAQIIEDLRNFNRTYALITGGPLNGWNESIGVTALQEWSQLNLKKLAREYSGAARHDIQILLDNRTRTVKTTCGKVLTSYSDVTGMRKIKDFALTEYQIAVDSRISTLEKIVGRWRSAAFTSYLEGKKIALVNQKTLKLMFFGFVTEDMIGLYRIHRNQPWARIYLNDRGN